MTFNKAATDINGVSQTRLRIVIADDHALVRDGIRARLEMIDNLEIVGGSIRRL